MLRRLVPCAVLAGLSACYLGLPQDDAASEASLATTGAVDPSGAAPTTGAGTTSAASTTELSAGTGLSDPLATDALDTGAQTTDPAGTGAQTTDPVGTEAQTTDASGTDGLETGEPGTSETGETGEPGTTGMDDTGEPPLDPAALMCQRWKSDRAKLGEGSWSGAVNTCTAGTVSKDGIDNALRLVNLYRFIAGLPAVTEDPARTSKAQSCALMMQANGQLSHSPPMSWKCWSADGASAAGQSSIAGTAGVLGVDLYMVDPGNETTIGHRRWILSNSLGPIGLGSTSGYSCMLVVGGNGQAGKAWVAWPPPGVVPLQALHVPEVFWTNTDKTGWTVQSDSIDLTAAKVSVKVAGVTMPVAVNVLGQHYGSTFAVRFVPQGWTVEPGKTYDVAVTGGAQPINYSVQIVDCL